MRRKEKKSEEENKPLFISGMILLINGIEDLVCLQKQIHLIENIQIPELKPALKTDIGNSNLNSDLIYKTLQYLDDIEERDRLCHLDFHLLNIMCSVERYYLIDWINAKQGNPVFDYARTYVILFEISQRLSQKYLSLIKKDKSIDTKDIEKAIFVMAVLRIKENDNDKVRQLIRR